LRNFFKNENCENQKTPRFRAAFFLFVVIFYSRAHAQTLAPGVTLTPVSPGYGFENLNSTSFSRHNLFTVGNTQYIAFYGVNTNVTLGSRLLGTTNWTLNALDPTVFKPYSAADGHDVVSIGIGADGIIHCSWGMHANPFNYARGLAPWSLNLVKTNMTGFENTVTYPQFINSPNGDLLFIFRQGGSGSGNTFINHYSAVTHVWTNVTQGASQAPFIVGETGVAATTCNAYPNFECFDAQTNLVMTWTWRNSAASIDYNHDTIYARSPDYGVTWLTWTNSTYRLPITQTNANNIWPIGLNHSLMNESGQCFDRSNRPVICNWWAPGGTGTPIQFFIIWNDGSQWRTNQIGNRTTTINQTWPTRPVIVCDTNNWLWVFFTDPERGSVPTVAWTADPNRAAWNFANLTSEFMGNNAGTTWGGWEFTYDPVRWQRDGKLDCFYQSIANATPVTQISVLEFDPQVFLANQPPPPQNFTWTNTVSGNWSSPANWSSNAPPPAGGLNSLQLQFSAVANYTATNDLAGNFLLNQLAVANSSATALAGNPLVFTNSSTTAPAISQTGSGAATIGTPLVLAAATALSVAGTVSLAGQISGNGALNVSGGGTLIFNASNNYSGATTLTGTTIVIGTNAFGSGTVNFSGGTLRWQTNCTDDFSQNRSVVLNSTTSFDPNGNPAVFAGNLSGNGGLTLQVGSGGTLTLAGSNSFNTAVNISTGTLVAANANALGASAASISIAGGSATTALGLQGGITLAKPLTFGGRQPLPNVAGVAAHLLNVSGTNIFAGNISCTTGGNQYNLESDAGQLIFAGIFSQSNGTGDRFLNLQGVGDANFTGVIADGTARYNILKRDAGRWILSGTNSYTGTTTVSNGTLLVNGSIGTNTVTVSGGTFGGGGSVLGALIVQTGGTLAPGNSFGTLTVSNSVALQSGSITLMTLGKLPLTNAQLKVTGTFAGGGSLLVTNVTGALAAGDSFRLFVATNSVNGFSSITLPTLVPGLVWNTNNFVSTGTIFIIGFVPVFNNLAVAGTNLLLRGSGGQPNKNYCLLASTNLALPLALWTRVATNTYDAGGNFTFTNAISQNRNQEFYAVQPQ
jgi:autotransporter-associated beta strand protein